MRPDAGAELGHIQHVPQIRLTGPGQDRHPILVDLGDQPHHLLALFEGQAHELTGAAVGVQPVNPGLDEPLYVALHLRVVDLSLGVEDDAVGTENSLEFLLATAGASQGRGRGSHWRGRRGDRRRGCRSRRRGLRPDHLDAVGIQIVVSRRRQLGAGANLHFSRLSQLLLQHLSGYYRIVNADHRSFLGCGRLVSSSNSPYRCGRRSSSSAKG